MPSTGSSPTPPKKKSRGKKSPTTSCGSSDDLKSKGITAFLSDTVVESGTSMPTLSTVGHTIQTTSGGKKNSKNKDSSNLPSKSTTPETQCAPSEDTSAKTETTMKYWNPMDFRGNNWSSVDKNTKNATDAKLLEKTSTITSASPEKNTKSPSDLIWQERAKAAEKQLLVSQKTDLLSRAARKGLSIFINGTSYSSCDMHENYIPFCSLCTSWCIYDTEPLMWKDIEREIEKLE